LPLCDQQLSLCEDLAVGIPTSTAVHPASSCPSEFQI
jgi:hypothetical protein